MSYFCSITCAFKFFPSPSTSLEFDKIVNQTDDILFPVNFDRGIKLVYEIVFTHRFYVFLGFM